VDFPVPEVRAIAERIVAEHPDAEIPTAEDIAREPEQRWIRNRRLANLFTEHLSGERFRYSTDLSEFRRRGGEDPIVLFLDRYRFGHCEYFASALVALCRSMGAEARVVTGYMATEYDSVTDRYVFRESGAHAWAEVRTGEWQWGTFDPSPMDELLAIQRANRTWMDSFRWILDPVEFMWNSRFASFDSRSQAELGDRVATGAKSASTCAPTGGSCSGPRERSGSRSSA
jgi:transglutaminase-like putative cysteine protease